MKRIFAILLLSAGLVACGFHLRGSYNMPPFLQQLVVTAPKGDLLRPEMVLGLNTVGVDTTQGELILQIEHDKLIRQTTAVDNVEKAAQYTLIFDVQYRLRHAASGRPATYSRHLYLRRTYQYDPTNVVAKSTEEETLISELHTDAVQQIIRQLSALTPERLLPDKDPEDNTAATTDYPPDTPDSAAPESSASDSSAAPAAPEASAEASAPTAPAEPSAAP